MARKTKSYEDGDVIFLEGDPGSRGFVILKGRVALSKDTSRGQVEIEVLGKSSSFGEVGVMNGGLRTLSATAVGTVTVELVEQGTAVDRTNQRMAKKRLLKRQTGPHRKSRP